MPQCLFRRPDFSSINGYCMINLNQFINFKFHKNTLTSTMRFTNIIALIFVAVTDAVRLESADEENTVPTQTDKPVCKIICAVSDANCLACPFGDTNCTLEHCGCQDFSKMIGACK